MKLTVLELMDALRQSRADGVRETNQKHVTQVGVRSVRSLLGRQVTCPACGSEFPLPIAPGGERGPDV